MNRKTFVRRSEIFLDVAVFGVTGSQTHVVRPQQPPALNCAAEALDKNRLDYPFEHVKQFAL